MTYQVLFDVSQRLPQLAIGVAAAVALMGVVAFGFWDSDATLERWPLVLILGATCVGLQWLIVGQWPFLLAGAVVVTIVVVLERAGRESSGQEQVRPERTVRAHEVIPGAATFMVGFFLLVLGAFQGLPMVQAIDLDRRLLAGEATIVEGTVTVESLGKSECLVVERQQFCYSESTISPGYNRQRYINGPLETGLHVRLSVIDDQIVRLEVGTEA
jgi:uncharacterized membrane protein